MQLSLREVTIDLRYGSTGNGKDADHKTQCKEWQNSQTITISIQTHGRSNFKKRREVTDRCISLDTQKRDDAVERRHSPVEQDQSKNPTENRDRSHDVDAQKQCAVDPLR